MWTFVSENKEWIFSGIGVAFLSVLFYLIRSIHRRPRPLREATVRFSPNVKLIMGNHKGRKNIHWDEMCEQIKLTAIAPMKENNWTPDLIICIGRGGAICGSIIASTMKTLDARIPILVINVKYAARGSKQVPDIHMIQKEDLLGRRKILIVDSNRQSSSTYNMVVRTIQTLSQPDSIEIRSYVLVWAPTSEELLEYPPDYLSYQADVLHPTRVNFPWYL